jgi:ATP-binding cassette subfamily B protein
MGRPTTIRDGAPRFFTIVRAFIPEVFRERRLAVAAIGALIASTILRVLEPWPIKFVLDLIAGDSTPAQGWLSQQLSRLAPSTVLLVAAVGVVVLTGLRALFDYLRTVGFALASNRVMGRLRSNLYRHLQRLSLSFHDQARSGDLLVRVTSDIKMLGDVTVTALLPLVASVLLLAAMFAVMFVMNWKLTLVVLAVLPLSSAATIRIGRRIHAAARKQREREGHMAATAAQAISSVKVVQALSLENAFEAEFAESNHRDLREGAKTQRLAARLERSMDVLVAVATALVIWTGGHMVLRAQLTVGELWLFYTYLKRALQPLQDFAKYASRLAKAVAAGERIVEIMDRTPDVREAPHAVVAPRLSGRITFDNVTFSYSPDRPLFNDVSFDVAAGRRLALVGGSGSGKSTLISLLLRLYEFDRGQITADGLDIRNFTLASLRGQFGVVLQDTVLFAATVEDNIAFGAPGATREQIEAAAQLANAHGFISALPDGYATRLGERGVNLSHGQRQRIAIARAAIRQTPILILDEPTTGLDQRAEHLVSEALDRISVGRTTILATHDLRRAASSDDIIVLSQGQVIERGHHADLMQRDGEYARMYRLQTEQLPVDRRSAEYVSVD